MTVTCWIKSDGLYGDYGNPVSKGGYAWQLAQSGTSDDIEFDVSGYGITTSANSPAVTEVDDDKWHHLAGVIAGDATYFYVDGVFAGSQSGGPPRTEGHKLWIGRGYYPQYGADYTDPETCEFYGQIDDVKLYDCPLTHDKIIAEYKAGGGSNSCGSERMSTDIAGSGDCHVTLADFAELAKTWLECNDIGNEDCDD
jgi:hypothetical protein